MVNTVERSTDLRMKHPSLLVGLLFDGEGQRMTPTYAVKHGTRYRYYVSGSLITRGRADVTAGLRLPAAEIEQIVTHRIFRLFTKLADLFPLIEQHIPSLPDRPCW
jgi:site-specific DNA recombinase